MYFTAHFVLRKPLLLITKKMEPSSSRPDVCLLNDTDHMYINRPGVAWVVLQTPLSLIKSVTDAFPPNLQNIITPKPLKIEG